MNDKEYEVIIENFVDEDDMYFEGPGINDIRYELGCCENIVNKAEMSKIIYLVMNHDDYKNYNISFWRVK